MKTDIRDVETFNSLQPTPIKEYLRSRGWTKTSDVGDRGEVWCAVGSEGEPEVLLPIDRGVADYGLRIRELIRTVARFEDRGQVAVVRDVMTANSDLIRIRLQTPNGAPGTLGFEDAVEVISHAEDLMLAAACAAVEPREHYPSRKFEQAKEYVRKLKMGQTEEGSFVLTILSRVAPQLQESLVDETDEGQDLPPDAPFERLVTMTLMEALRAADDAARAASATGDFAPFKQAVDYGVSANLCDALLGLSGADEDLPFDVALAWAPNRGRPDGVPNRVGFSPDRLQVFEEVSRRFKAKSPREEFELEGAIIRLDREGDAGPGIIRVMGAVENRTRKVEVELQEDDFENAIEAFGNHTPVRLYGKLQRSGRKYRLENPHGFELLPDED